MPRPMPPRDQLSSQWRLPQITDRAQSMAFGDLARELWCTLGTFWRDLGGQQQVRFWLCTE